MIIKQGTVFENKVKLTLSELDVVDGKTYVYAVVLFVLGEITAKESIEEDDNYIEIFASPIELSIV